MYSSTLPLTSALDGVGGQRHTPVALPPEKDPLPIVQEAVWAPGSVWTGGESLAPHRDSIPGPSSPQRVVIPTELSWPFLTQQGKAYFPYPYETLDRYRSHQNSMSDAHSRCPQATHITQPTPHQLRLFYLCHTLQCFKDLCIFTFYYFFVF